MGERGPGLRPVGYDYSNFSFRALMRRSWIIMVFGFAVETLCCSFCLCVDKKKVAAPNYCSPQNMIGRLSAAVCMFFHDLESVCVHLCAFARLPKSSLVPRASWPGSLGLQSNAERS